jgi:hypothetical protein
MLPEEVLRERSSRVLESLESQVEPAAQAFLPASVSRCVSDTQF